MATSVLMASEDARESERTYGGFEELRPEKARQDGRRKSRSNKQAQKKKEPQRGMGVAQLERLRLQERWKKMTHPNLLQSLNLHNHYLLPTPFPDPISAGTVPVPFSKFGSHCLGLNQALLLQGVGNGGLFSGQVGGYGVGGVFSDQFQADPYGIGNSNPILWAGNVAETSKELTSMPNMKCHSDRCGQSHKKMRVNGENLGCSFLGFSLGNTQNIDGQNQDFSSGINVDQAVEVLAVHRTGSSWGGSIFMEYEFFPGKVGRGSSSKEFDIGFGSKTEEASSVAVCGGDQGSCVSTTTTSTGFDASNSIDLSLKLSY